MWVVVHFTSEDNVETVPRSWYSEGKCWWPIQSDTSKIVKLIEKNGIPNEETWLQIPARKLGKSYDSLSAARNARNKAQTLSEFSDSSPTGKGHRKRIEKEPYSPEIIKKSKPARLKLLSSSEDEEYENEASPLSPFPPLLRRSPRKSPLKKNSNTTHVKKNLFSKSSEIRDPSRISQSQPITLKSPELRDKSSMVNLQSHSGSSYKQAGASNTSNTFEKEVIRSLNFIKSQIRKLSEQVETLSETRPASWAEPNEQPVVNFQDFPLKTETEVNEFDNSLDDTGRKALVGNLVSLGGLNTSDTTKRMLRYLFTDEVASNYSWLGLKQKKPFKQLKLAGVIQESVMKNNKCVGATLKEIEDVVKNWLRVAKYRAASKKVHRQGPEEDKD